MISIRYCISIVVAIIVLSGSSEAIASEVLHPDSVLYPGRIGSLPRADSMMIYTAHQSFDSRIYILNLDGSVFNYFHYSNYFFGGLEVVNNEVYAAEAFAPRVLKVNLTDGSLDVIVDDWSLYYFYDVCFDGTFFYVDEWDMNRYEFNGDKDGSASFDEDVMGLEYDGSYLWMQNDENLIKCYEIGSWPTIIEIPDNNITPPSPDCRGLFFDGQYFWTAENIEDNLGYIYKFDYDGHVIAQFAEPAFQGWGVCLIRPHIPPCIPQNPQPSDDVSEVSINTGLSWECSEYDPEKVGFDVYFGTSEPLELIAADQHSLDHTFDSALAYETSYLWQVVAIDQANDSSTGPVWTFTTQSFILCGDANTDLSVDISDAVYLINYAFGGGPAPDPVAVGDTNCDGSVDVSDAVYIINFAFGGGNPPCDTNADSVPDC